MTLDAPRPMSWIGPPEDCGCNACSRRRGAGRCPAIARTRPGNSPDVSRTLRDNCADMPRTLPCFSSGTARALPDSARQIARLILRTLRGNCAEMVWGTSLPLLGRCWEMARTLPGDCSANAAALPPVSRRSQRPYSIRGWSHHFVAGG